MNCLLCSFAVASAWLALGTTSIHAANFPLRVTVEAAAHARVNTPVCVPLDMELSADEGMPNVVVRDGNGTPVAGQITGPGLLSTSQQPELHFILPALAAGESATFTVERSEKMPANTYRWQDTPDAHRDLLWDEQPVMSYMYTPLDDSSAAAREQTYKPFHHLYDPSGQHVVTKGAGGTFTHHRGLFYGFNRITYGNGKKADTWHAAGDAYQSHEEFLSEEAGPVLGRHRMAIDWHGEGKEVFAREEREMTVYRVPDGQLVEFASRLAPTSGAVRLDGDPQHAGFQFRAAQEVAEKTNKQTYYLRPDGAGKPGETINWEPNNPRADTIDQPWKGLSFVLGDQRYTAAYLDRPENPKEARYSERDYGRFGSYFEYDLTAEKPLELNYRLWLQTGEMTGDEIERLAADFVEPPKTSLAGKGDE